MEIVVRKVLRKKPNRYWYFVYSINAFKKKTFLICFKTQRDLIKYCEDNSCLPKGDI